MELYTYQPYEFIHAIVPIDHNSKVIDLATKFKDAYTSILWYLKSVFPEGVDYNLFGT